MAPSSSSLNWVYDVFLSFRGEDVRKNFRSHFLKELDRKLITAFKDNEIEPGYSLSPVLVQAIKNSKIAVVVFSKNYASSSWCLNELLEIVNCKDKIVIPIFYKLDPSHVRKQTGDFGKIFEETCKNSTEGVKNQWRKALTDVANKAGFHSATCDDEAKMIEEVANKILCKLLSTSPEDSVGIKDHIAKMSELLQLESEEVRMVGIWGSPGIGKTTIAIALYNQLSGHFQVSQFIDRRFVSEIKNIYSGANPDDYNMKLGLQEKFLLGILGIKDIKIYHLRALEERLNHQKVLIIIDDLDDQMVLDSLAAKPEWFGSGSRIIVVTNDKHFLRAHNIGHIYEVSLPTQERAREMLCQSAFKRNSPPLGFEKLVDEVVRYSGSLPLCLNVLGSSLRGQKEEYWMNMLPRLQNGIDGKIEKALRVSYDGLRSEEDKAIFRHIACLFNHVGTEDIKFLLADSKLCIGNGLENLADKSLIHVRGGQVEMHHLLEEMGRKVVRMQSIYKPGKREFLVNSEDICDVLRENTGTPNVLGISLDIDVIDELDVHESAFKGMRNLHFLEIYPKKYIRTLFNRGLGRLRLPGSFDYLPPKLKLLRWENYPFRRLPSNFRPVNLVKLSLQGSELEKLWEGVVSLPCLKEMDMGGSRKLKEIPDLSMATNLEELNLYRCESLVDLPPSIRNLYKLWNLEMSNCTSLETLPTGVNLKSLSFFDFEGCSQLRTFPEFSTNVSALILKDTNIEEFPSILHLENLVRLRIWGKKSERKQREGMKLTPFLAMLPPTLKRLELGYIPSLVEIPSSLQNLNQLRLLHINHCINLEILPTEINLKSLDELDLSGCSRLRSFPEISTNISRLFLRETAIEEVPRWIVNFSKLCDLRMNGCKNLETLPTGINLKSLTDLDLSGCSRLRSFPKFSTNLLRLSMCEGIYFRYPTVSFPWTERSRKRKRIDASDGSDADEDEISRSMRLLSI